MRTMFKYLYLRAERLIDGSFCEEKWPYSERIITLSDKDIVMLWLEFHVNGRKKASEKRSAIWPTENASAIGQTGSLCDAYWGRARVNCIHVSTTTQRDNGGSDDGAVTAAVLHLVRWRERERTKGEGVGGKEGGGRGEARPVDRGTGRVEKGGYIEGRGSGKGCGGVRSSVLGNWVNEKIEKERRCYRGSAQAQSIARPIPTASSQPSFIPPSTLFPESLSRKIFVSVMEQLKSSPLLHMSNHSFSSPSENSMKILRYHFVIYEENLSKEKFAIEQTYLLYVNTGKLLFWSFLFLISETIFILLKCVML